MIGIKSLEQYLLYNYQSDKTTLLLYAELQKHLQKPLVMELKDAALTFKGHRDAQLGKKGAVGNLKSTAATSRAALELQLTANIHFIAYTWPGDVQQCMAFFDQSIVRDEQRDEDAPPVA